MNKNKLFTYSIILTVAYLIYRLLILKDQTIDVINQLPRSGNWQQRDVNQITDITIHHSATVNGTPESFANYHVKVKGWPAIGYHFVIDKAGNIFKTNNYEDYSYHNGYNNKNAIGICLVGNFTIEELAYQQAEALSLLIEQIKREVPSVIYLQGHREYEGNTTCPAFDVSPFRDNANLADRQNLRARPIAKNITRLTPRNDADN